MKRLCLTVVCAELTTVLGFIFAICHIIGAPTALNVFACAILAASIVMLVVVGVFQHDTGSTQDISNTAEIESVVKSAVANAVAEAATVYAEQLAMIEYYEKLIAKNEALDLGDMGSAVQKAAASVILGTAENRVYRLEGTLEAIDEELKNKLQYFAEHTWSTTTKTEIEELQAVRNSTEEKARTARENLQSILQVWH